MSRDIEELRAIAVKMGKPLDKLLYEMLTDAMNENKELKEDISFCLKSIKQEMEMSTDSRTRQEMKSCCEILERWNNE